MEKHALEKANNWAAKLQLMYARYHHNKVNGTCLICDRSAMTSFPSVSFAGEYICGRCGAYRVSEDFVWEMPEPDNPLHEFRYRISWAFRTASERVADIRDLPVHVGLEIIPLLNTVDPVVEDKLGSLLTFLAKQCLGPGKYSSFDPANDDSTVCARDEEEALFLLTSLEQQRLIELPPTSLDALTYTYRLTAAGWSELTRRERGGADSNNAFIAMSFAPERASTGEAIGSAVIATNHVPIRMDRIEHSNRIDDEILSRLRSSKFLIVDLTRQNPGAYFEAGFILGLGRPVIWVCSKEDLKNVHFDTRQYNIIDFDSNEDLQRRLQLRIEAVIGKGMAAQLSAN